MSDSSDLFANVSSVSLVVQDGDLVRYLVPSSDNTYVDASYTGIGAPVFWAIVEAAAGDGYYLQVDQSYYMADFTVNVRYRSDSVLALTDDISKALKVMPYLDSDGTTFYLQQVDTDKAVTLDTRGTLGGLETLIDANDLPVFQHFIFEGALSSWSDFGSGFDKLVTAMGNQVFGVDSASDVYQYQGALGWVQVAEAVHDIAGNLDAVYIIPASKDCVQQSGWSDPDWVQVGDAIGLESLAAYDHEVLGLTADQQAFRFSSDDNAWEDLGSPALSELIASAYHICGLSADGGTVLHYDTDASPAQWNDMGADATHLVGATNAAYCVKDDGLYRFAADDATWTKVSEPASAFTGYGTTVFKLDDDGVSGLNDDDAWVPIADAADALVAGANYLFGLREEKGDNKALLLEGWGAEVLAVQDDALQSPSAASGSLADDATNQWIFTFATKDELFAGYDGRVDMALVDGTEKDNLVLPRTHFVRGETYTFELYSSVDEIDGGIYLRGVENYWGDEWHLGTVTAYSANTWQYYTFDFNCNVPLSSSVLRDYTSKVEKEPTDDPAIVHIWSYRGLNEAVGHASMTMPDGETYISWWPSGVDYKELPFLPVVYSAVGDNPANLDEDTDLEGQAPDVNVKLWYLNNDDVKTWWNDFLAAGNDWVAATQNCSTTVYQAITAGGGLDYLTSSQQDNYDTIAIWTPNDILALVNDISAAEHG